MESQVCNDDCTYRPSNNKSSWQRGSTVSLSGTVQCKRTWLSGNDLFEEINEQHVFPILLAATLTNAISNGYCVYHWPHLKKLEIFLLLSPKILLILSWKYNGYKLKKKILAILKSLPSCMCVFFTTSTNCASNRVVKLTSITMEIWKKISSNQGT